MPYESPKKEETFFNPVKSPDNAEGLEQQLKKVAPPVEEAKKIKPLDMAAKYDVRPQEEKPIKEIKTDTQKEIVAEVEKTESEIETVFKEGFEKYTNAKSPEERNITIAEVVNRLAA